MNEQMKINSSFLRRQESTISLRIEKLSLRSINAEYPVHGTVYILSFSRLRGNDGFFKHTYFE
jgi:hypothetical protein